MKQAPGWRARGDHCGFQTTSAFFFLILKPPLHVFLLCQRGREGEGERPLSTARVDGGRIKLSQLPLPGDVYGTLSPCYSGNTHLILLAIVSPDCSPRRPCKASKLQPQPRCPPSPASKPEGLKRFFRSRGPIGDGVGVRLQSCKAQDWPSWGEDLVRDGRSSGGCGTQTPRRAGTLVRATGARFDRFGIWRSQSWRRIPSLWTWNEVRDNAAARGAEGRS